MSNNKERVSLNFETGKAYHTTMSDGTMFRVTSVFCVESNGKKHWTLWGEHIGYEDLGGTTRLDQGMFVKEASWREAFDRWLHIRLKRLDWKITKQLEQQIGNIL